MKKTKLKNILLVLLVLVGLGAAVGGSFAAYTSQAYQRGVARNRDNEVVRFASDYLQSCAGTITDAMQYPGRTKLYSEDQKGTDFLSFDFSIYNYASGNENLVSQKDITYDLVIIFSEGGGSGYSVSSADGANFASEANTKYTLFGRTLIGRSAKEHKYTVTFPGSDLDKVKITITAIPTNLSVTNNQMLAAVIAPCTGSSTKTFSYEGKFIYEASTTPENYSGFNYEVSISSGEAIATITWNKKLVEIDKFFLKNMGKSEDEIKQILSDESFTFTMNQAEGTGDYLIPFYIKDKGAIKTKSWADMQGTTDNPGVVSFVAVQKTQTTEDTGN